MKLKIQKFATEAEWLEARKSDITTTEVAALFGLSPYQTAFELFHRKRDSTLVQPFDSDRMKWGRRLQPVIASGVADDMGWRITHDGDLCYAPHPTVERMGASFDYVYESLDGTGALEIKNVDGLIFRNEWVSDGENSEAPAHIELQLQAQLECLDLERGAIVALVGGNRAVVIQRERDREVGEVIARQVRAFWDRIARNDPPPPDFVADAEFISRLYGYAEPGKVLDLAKAFSIHAARIAQLVATYKDAGETIAAATDAKDAARAEILTLIGEHERVTSISRDGSGFVISTPMVAPAEVAYTRAGYRTFRVTMKKPKK
jgi:putative phage-type endonuclease